MKTTRHLLSTALLLLLTFSGPGCISVDLGSMLNQELKEVVLFKDEGPARDKILLIDLRGVITPERSSGLFGSSGTTPDYIRAVLNRAKKDEQIKGVLLRINSPG
ncbi:MAG: hypothetical protein AAF492_21605, partial [Verrucomicrobiota bacterium]